MRLALAFVLVVVLAPRPARATYSIVASDVNTREVGGAGTSCVGALSVSVIYGPSPGHGAVHAQALLGGPGKNEAVAQVGLDVAPVDIIAAITDAAFDGNAASRQYGIVDLMGRSAGFTGTSTLAYAEDRQGQVGPWVYSVQGNILTSGAVLDQAATSFETQGCDLADRLMLALEAGAANGEGDSRCTGNGIPSDSAFLAVDPEGMPAGQYLLLDVTDSAPASPLVELRVQYDAWRADNPCPAPPTPDAGPGDGDAGPGGDGDQGGCGCRAAPRRTPAGGLALAAFFAAAAVLARRRQRKVTPAEGPRAGSR